MKKMKYLLYDGENNRVFIGLHENAAYFSDNPEFIEENGISKVATFDDYRDVMDFKRKLVMNSDLKSLTPMAIQCEDRYATVEEISRLGFKTQVANLLLAYPTFSDMIH